MRLRSRTARAILCAAFSFPLAVSTGASAADKSATARPSKAATDEARERFKKGVELFRDGDFRAALIEFNRANEIAPNPKIQFNIAQTCLEMQDYGCALRAFERYLGEGGAEVSKERRQTSERELERLKKLVGYLRITSNKDGAEVLIDDAPVGRTPLADPMLVGAGRHKITVSLPPIAPASRVVDVAGGDRLDVALDLAQPPPAPVVAPLRAEPAPSAESGLAPLSQTAPAQRPLTASEQVAPSRAPFWIGFVTTGVLAVGAAATGALALSAKSDLDRTVERPGLSSAELDSAQTKVRTFALAADVLLVSTIVGVGVTSVLFFTSSPSKSVARLQRAPGLLNGTF